ncbi:23S rRNA (pseudouridine(1915)-N(3))-methyltransferase RlmH [Lichenihabitans psoromatis]|uniref:23S rRNA (pseudouridine(1915)-N(3))-methyltransferase RlmH n=1 Tax=Lichenihabitans psoromatis TaxID=2528642 RepID=UPI00103644C3|nr:23S rRNA (pseudouridine(1915)-N(3))-methyltransferase RlmH [Lichenihabitans psoromatis]
MKIVLLAVGRMKTGPERELMTRYMERAQAIGRSVGLTAIAVRELDESRARSSTERKREEGRAILAECPSEVHIVALDERGASLGSEAFAGKLGVMRDAGTDAVAIVIGGADGLSEDVRARAALCLCYGAATFPHQIVRVLAAEQIYRACTILAGHPYHRG